MGLAHSIGSYGIGSLYRKLRDWLTLYEVMGLTHSIGSYWIGSLYRQLWDWLTL